MTSPVSVSAMAWLQQLTPRGVLISPPLAGPTAAPPLLVVSTKPTQPFRLTAMRFSGMIPCTEPRKSFRGRAVDPRGNSLPSR